MSLIRGHSGSGESTNFKSASKILIKMLPNRSRTFWKLWFRYGLRYSVNQTNIDQSKILETKQKLPK